MSNAEHQRVNASLERAAKRHGAAFHQAYDGLMRFDHSDPRACAAIKDIWHASDPGSMLIAVWEAMVEARASTLN
jgi:hypothetical protein